MSSFICFFHVKGEDSDRHRVAEVKVKLRARPFSSELTVDGGENYGRKMREAELCGLILLLLDAALSLLLWAALVQLECYCCGGLAGVWAFGAIKWASLRVFASQLTEGKSQAVLGRLVALLCLLSPVLESGRVLMASPSDPYQGPTLDLGMLLTGPLASGLACVVWEKGLCGPGRRKQGGSSLDAKRLLMRVLRYFKPDTLHLVAAFTFLILGVVCDTFIPLYQGRVIDMLRGPVLQSGFGFAIARLALVSFGSSLFSGLRGGTFMWTLSRLNKRLKHLLFHTLLQQELNFFESNKPGSLSSRLHADVDRMGRTVALNSNALVRSTVKTCLMLWVMIDLSWELTVLTFIEMPLLAVLQNKYMTWSTELKEQIQDCLAENRDLASQTVSKIYTVRSFKAEDLELKRYNKAVEHMSAVKRRAGIYSATFLLIRRLVTLGIKILMLVRARSLISSGRLSIGSFVSFLLYQKPMSHNLREILFSCGETMSTVGVISKVFSYLDREPQRKKEGTLAPEKLLGRVVFQNVSFTYPSALQDKPALKSVSLELQPGKMTALVGPSGGGKTSCVSLLLRLYEPQEGQILLDQEPLHHYKLKYLQQKMASVSQSPELFSGSLRYNIEYGLKGCSMETVREAARKANATDFISNLENEYDTDVGEGGGGLSESQKQCIAIIRALVRDPQVLILDEATSRLDVEMQHAVLSELLSCGRTVLVVAHQLKTVENADNIVFIENGEVVEEGTHRELVAKRGRYYEFSQTAM